MTETSRKYRAANRLLWPTLIALLLALNGCGFQLRGVTDLPPELSPILVSATGSSRIRPALRRMLSASGAALTQDPAQAGSRIRILEEIEDDRVAAVDSQGKVIATELIYRVRFDARDGAGNALVAAQNIVLAREYVNPEIEVIGKTEEAQLIRQDMVDDMADRILHRLKARLRQ